MRPAIPIILVACTLAKVIGVAGEISAPRVVTGRSASLRSDTPVDGSSMPVVSANGQFVAFISRSPNLLSNANGLSYQVFLRDLTSSNVILVSANLADVGGNDHSTLPSLSSNAAFIAFESEATDLVPRDTNRACDVFVRDVAQGRTILVTGGNGPARNAMISEDGRYVAFETRASNVFPNDTNAASDVVRYDLLQGNAELVSVSLSGQPANRGSELLSMTPDGRFIAFWSSATDISLEATKTIGEAYVRDMQAGTTFCLTETIHAPLGELRRFNAVLTPDGRYAAIQKLELGESFVPTGAEGEVRRVEVVTGAITNASDGARVRGSLGISDDGNQLIFYNRFFYNSSNFLCLRNLSFSTNRILVPVTSDVGSYRMSKDFQTLFFTMLVGTNYQLFKHELSSGSTQLLSTNRLGEPLAAGVASSFSIDPSGSVVAFEAPDGDTGVPDFNGAPDVYAVGYRVVAPRDPSLPENTGPGLLSHHPASVSADGARIAFTASDSFLVADDTNKLFDVFLADVIENSLLLRKADIANYYRLNETAPMLSANGRFLLFGRTTADNCCVGNLEHYRVDLDTGLVHWLPLGSFQSSQDGRWLVMGGGRILLTDFRTPSLPGQPTNQVVDVNYQGTGPANDGSVNPIMSLDGDWVAFLSFAGDLTTNSGFRIGVPQAFARNISRGRTRLLSVSPSTGNALADGATNLVLSANSRFATYQTLTGNRIYRHDLTVDGPAANVMVCSQCSRPSISGDGQIVTYISNGQILVQNVATGAIENLGGDLANDPHISVDGRLVVFVSRQSGNWQIFLRDRWQGTTHLLSRDYAGTGPGNGPSNKPVISHDGRTITFNSFASNLVPGDFNSKRDLFVVQITPIDSDGDYIDDDWEMHYFQNLARDGAGNADGDHVTDLQEYLAGTDPLDASSVLRFSGISSRVVDGTMQDTELRWQSAPGRTYRVQHKTAIDADWGDFADDVFTGGLNGSVNHVVSRDSRGFYRVMLGPVSRVREHAFK